MIINLKHLKNCHNIYSPSSFKSLVEEIREPMKELENLEKANNNDKSSTRSYEVVRDEKQRIVIKIINNVEKHMEEQAIKRGLGEL